MIEQRRLALYGFDTKFPDYQCLAERLGFDENGLQEEFNTKRQSRKLESGSLPEKVSLLDGYLLLAVLEDPICHKIDFGKLRGRVESRNNSLFAHGFAFINDSQYANFKALRCELAEGIVGKDENYEIQLRYLSFSSYLSDADLAQIAALILKDEELFDNYLTKFPFSNVQDRWFGAILISGFAKSWPEIPEEKKQVIIEAAQRLFKDESLPVWRSGAGALGKIAGVNEKVFTWLEGKLNKNDGNIHHQRHAFAALGGLWRYKPEVAKEWADKLFSRADRERFSDTDITASFVFALWDVAQLDEKAFWENCDGVLQREDSRITSNLIWVLNTLIGTQIIDLRERKIPETLNTLFGTIEEFIEQYFPANEEEIVQYWELQSGLQSLRANLGITGNNAVNTQSPVVHDVIQQLAYLKDEVNALGVSLEELKTQFTRVFEDWSNIVRDFVVLDFIFFQAIMAKKEVIERDDVETIGERTHRFDALVKNLFLEGIFSILIKVAFRSEHKLRQMFEKRLDNLKDRVEQSVLQIYSSTTNYYVKATLLRSIAQIYDSKTDTNNRLIAFEQILPFVSEDNTLLAKTIATILQRAFDEMLHNGEHASAVEAFHVLMYNGVSRQVIDELDHFLSDENLKRVKNCLYDNYDNIRQIVEDQTEEDTIDEEALKSALDTFRFSLSVPTLFLPAGPLVKQKEGMRKK